MPHQFNTWVQASEALRPGVRRAFRQAIDLGHGNQAKATRWLRVTRLKMREKLKEFGLRPDADDTRATPSRANPRQRRFTL